MENEKTLSAFAILKEFRTSPARFRAILNYSNKWKELIEEGLKNGGEFKTVAKNTMYLAVQDDHISVTMREYAIRLLKARWERGEELSDWYKDMRNW